MPHQAMRHPALLAGALAAVILGGGIPAFAQADTAAAQSPSASDADPATTPTDTVQESIVVTASLEEEEATDLPSAVTVFTEEDMERRQTTAVLELLRTAPGLDVVQQGSPGKFTSVFTRGANSAQTLVLWNGVPLNDPSFGGFDWAFLTTEGVAAVEVVRGSTSALYGSEAIGGVVQVLTRRGDRATRLRLEAGGDDHRRGSVAAGMPLGDPLHVDLAASLWRSDGELANDSFDGESAVGRLSWRPAERLALNPTVRWNDAEVGLPLDFLGNPSPRQVSFRDSLDLALPWAWSGAAWQVEGHVYDHASDLATDDPDAGFSSFIDGERQGARLVVTRELGAGRWLAGGGEWEDEAVDTGGTFGPGLEGESQQTTAAFVQLHAATGPVTFEVGGRHDDNDAFGDETSLRGGVVWRATPALRLRASWGEGFRAPSLGELFFPGFGNPDLGPETSETREIGLEWDPRPWRLVLSAFDIDLEGLIVSGPPSFIPLNVGRARSRGVEASFGYEGRTLLATWNATWLDAEDEVTGEPLVRRPEWRSHLVLTWDPAPRRRALPRLTTEARWVGERTDLGSVELEAYTRVDLAASWRAHRLVEPYGRVENLFDESYQEAAGFPAPDRRLVGGVALSF